MKSYRLVVRQQGRIVGYFDTAGNDARKMSAWPGRCLASPVDTSAICWFQIANGGFWKVDQRG